LTISSPTRTRPRWRSYLLLSRVSNLPTVWSNVLAGIVASQAGVSWPDVIRLSIAVSLLYTAGMFLNDVADRDSDAVHRRDRPIPAGDVTLRSALTVGLALLVAGEIVIAAQPRFLTPLLWSLGLVAAIVYYDYRHKRDPLGPLFMGICRGLVYCVAAAAVANRVAPSVLAAAAALTAYVVGLTWIAKRLGPSAGFAVPILLAGISLVDAAVILVSGGGPALALTAAAGCPLTLLLQRVVPGT
jgi:4-hydroxybenzoate polyprenyltransferase